MNLILERRRKDLNPIKLKINMNRTLILIAVLSALFMGCSDDLLMRTEKENELMTGVEAYLSLSVNDFSVTTDGSRAAEPSQTPEPTSEEEKLIKDIWVFQFAADDGRLLVSPIYKVIDNQAELSNVKVDLAEDIESDIFVIANTGNPNWAVGKNTNVTYGELKQKALSNPEPIIFTEFRPIPMEGVIRTAIKKYSIVKVPVNRMYAKIKVSFGKLLDGMTPKSIEINNIPYYCRVKSLGEGVDEAAAAAYEEGTDWITRSFVANVTSGEDDDPKDKEYVIYIPENLQGEKEITDNKNKNDIAPSNALVIRLTMIYKDPTTEMDEDCHYTVYPGGNIKNNFNIRRNCVYRVKVNVNNIEEHTPSSNCFVVKPHSGISFEPYYRVETGGQYGDDADMFKFNTYLDPNDPTKDKVIDRVQILWQTKNAIGDNTKGDLVQFKLNEKYPLHSEIIVKTNRALKTSDDESTRSGEPTYIKTDGNALIGAFNEKGDIIWSWHIWITDKDPGNVGNAVVYTTYRWEGDKIVDGETVQGKIYSYAQGIEDNQVYDRVPGYAVMPCNLGALDFTPKTNNAADIARTFGMLYQWGRKDPFPPSINPRKGDFEVDYSENEAGVHYDYSNDKNVRKTYTQDATFPFHTKLGKDLDNPIVFSINNPLVFINGLISDQANHTKLYNYFARGDWMETHNNKLWGGLDPTSEGLSKLTISGPIIPEGKYIYNNYGDKKTIYDPCPSGWRVPPGDLWLGFTKNGTNPSSNDDINYDVTSTNNTHFGMYLYLQKSKWDTDNPGKTLFFPTQGIRISTGQLKNTGQCGNYHNATSNDLDEVNVLHVHNDWARFHLFEFQYIFYNVKSIAGPIRCVRDRK